MFYVACKKTDPLTDCGGEGKDLVVQNLQDETAKGGGGKKPTGDGATVAFFRVANLHSGVYKSPEYQSHIRLTVLPRLFVYIKVRLGYGKEQSRKHKLLNKCQR